MTIDTEKDEEFNLACFFGLHTWGKWEQESTYSISNRITEEPTGKEYIMKRTCKCCGDIQLKTEIVKL